MDNNFASRYLAGELYDGSGYSNSNVGELLTYKYEASDGDVMVWQHAFDLRAFGKQGKQNSSTCEMKRGPCMDPTLCHVHLRVKNRRRSGHFVPLHRRTGLPQRRKLGADGRAALCVPGGRARSLWQGLVCHAARACRCSAETM